MNRLREEFEKNLSFDGAEYGSNWEKEDVWNWINKNYISKEEILELEELKVIDLDTHEHQYWSKGEPNTCFNCGKTREELIKNSIEFKKCNEIKEAINNLKPNEK